MPNDFSELVSVIASFLFLIISLFIHVYLLRYIRLFSFLLSYGKTRATKNIQLVTQQGVRVKIIYKYSSVKIKIFRQAGLFGRGEGNLPPSVSCISGSLLPLSWICSLKPFSIAIIKHFA